MNYLLIGIIVILFIVVTFMLMIFLPKPQCFYVPIETCRELLLFNKDDNAATISKELKDIKEDTDIYTIVDNQIHADMNKWTTLETLLHTIPDLQAVSIKVIPAKLTEEKPQKAHPSSILRCVFPLETPVKKAGIWCDGERRLFKQYEWTIYNLGKEHYYFNEAKRGNAKLVVIDITNPYAEMDMDL